MPKTKLCKNIFLKFCIICLIITLYTPFLGQNINFIKNLERDVSELCKKALIPGLSIAVIQEGKIFWVKNYGVRGLNSKKKVTNNTIFEAASLSKPIFAYAVMKLVEKGQLDLDTPLIDYISREYLKKEFLGKNIENERIYKISARMCLTHTSGFPNWRTQGELKIINKPGEKFSYSGEGFGYLQCVIEKITGLSLNEFIKKEVFHPLGMLNSSFIWEESYALKTSYPHGIMGNQNAKIKDKRGHAAATLHTTASDYAKYIMAIMNQKGLKKETIASILTPQIIINPKESNNVTWGLGVALEQTKRGINFWHWGDNTNFRCFFMASMKEKAGVCFFTNSANGLSIAKHIVGLILNTDHPVFSEISLLKGFGDVANTEMEFIRTLRSNGLEAALKIYHHHSDSLPLHQIVSERTMNKIGYYYLREKKLKIATKIFDLNTKAFPNSSKVWDSLGEAYIKSDHLDKAIKFYEKSLQLNLKNENARNMIKVIQKKKK